MTKVASIGAYLALCVLFTACGSSGSDSAAVSNFASFTPLTATTLTVADRSTATVQYQVTNASGGALSLAMTPVDGITQTVVGPGLCPNPIVLAAAGESCVLSLQIAGSEIDDTVAGGPELCLAGGATCSEPADVDRLNLTRLPLFVGSCYSGGVIFYLNDTPNAPAGQQGLIAALADTSPTGEGWSIGSFPSVGTSYALFTGSSNTSLILTGVADNPGTEAPAALAASIYTENTYHDWYLPSHDELLQLYIQANATPTLFSHCSGGPLVPNDTYWSSSQYDTVADQAWYLNTNGFMNPDNYGAPKLIRAIRAF